MFKTDYHYSLLPEFRSEEEGQRTQGEKKKGVLPSPVIAFQDSN